MWKSADNFTTSKIKNPTKNLMNPLENEFYLKTNLIGGSTFLFMTLFDYSNF